MLTTQTAFPNNANTPACIFQFPQVSRVALTVRLYLVPPKCRTRFRPRETIAIMAVPKAAMNQNYGAIFRKNNVRSSRHIFRSQPKPKACTVQQASYVQFGFGVFPLNPRHDFASCFFVEDVCHTSGHPMPQWPIALPYIRRGFYGFLHIFKRGFAGFGEGCVGGVVFVG